MVHDADLDFHHFNRESKNLFGRIFTVNLREGVRYYLKTFMLHVFVAVIFISRYGKCLSNSFSTYCEAFLQTNLLSINAEWKYALHDALHSPFLPLTEHIGNIHTHCEPAYPIAIIYCLRIIQASISPIIPKVIWTYPIHILLGTLCWQNFVPL